jgi:outer membrane receptor protein involved in Fe transport
LSNLLFATDAKYLNEVLVTGQKRLIEKTSTGFIINAAANITQLGGTATDLLKSTPTVAVDAEGGITLRGKAPLILINGRNSNLTNSDQIPASSIESIEIINNASAKYDANAESGIINIVLKKNKESGTNGAAALGVGRGSRNRINSSFLLNHKTDKWNIGLGYDNRFAGRTRHITNNRTNFNVPDSYLIDQFRNDKRVERLQNLKFNVDFTPNKKNNFYFEAIGNVEGQDNDEDLTSVVSKQTNVFNYATDRQSLEYRRAKVGEAALNYSRNFDNTKKSLTASLTSSYEKGRENTDITTKVLSAGLSALGDPYLQRTHNYEDGIISNAQLDHAFPIAKNGIFETGYKGIFRSIKNDYQFADKTDNDYVINPASTNIFNFHEQVHAAYVLFHSSIGNVERPKWKYDIGLRAENVDNNGKTQTQNVRFNNHYFKLFPTANLTYKINSNDFWKLSYGKRINRPRLGQLNPFVDITDILNPHSGNPNLKPEIIHALEVGYNKEWSLFDFSTNIFYRYSQNTIRSFLTQQENGAVLSLPKNIGTTNSFGLENIITGKPAPFYDFNLSFTLFQQYINGGNVQADAIQNSFNWFGKLINNFSIGHSGKVQLTGNYNSATTTPQGKLIPLYNIDFGFQQKLGKAGNARIGVVVVDAFNTLKSGYNTRTSSFQFSRTQKSDTRAVMLTFAYTFKSAFKEKLMDNQFSKEY